MSLQGPLGLKSISVHTTVYYLSSPDFREVYVCYVYTQTFVNKENYLSVIALGKVYDFINPLTAQWQI